MTLFSAPTDPWSHRTRLVLAEKGIAIELVNVDLNDLPEDLLDLNPYHSVPTLVDRDLVLYDSRVIIEYLDERFPHPPLMPIDPVTRAQFRVALYRVERDWYALARDIELDRRARPRPTAAKCWVRRFARARKYSRPSRSFSATSFPWWTPASRPILWRLPQLRHRAAGAGAAHHQIHEFHFRALHAFARCLTEAERDMRH